MFHKLQLGAIVQKSTSLTHIVPVEWTDNEDYQLEDAEDQAVLRRRGPLLLRLKKTNKKQPTMNVKYK